LTRWIERLECTKERGISEWLLRKIEEIYARTKKLSEDGKERR
jgi:hypothetical protein